MKTHSVTPDTIQKKWLLVDGNGKTLGRLITRVAGLLIGKHKVIFSPHMDVGDHVILINADKIRVTGKKPTQKFYHHFSGYPGGLTSISYAKLFARSPEKVIEIAVRGMLPNNKLRERRLKKLKIYKGGDHPHQAQRPEPIDL
ncbi:MAG: 50S ribosomal protein L13 [Armatimonadetes bacterium]|nr:50S ribosomal protein L13 [Armatimonadota bacterium]